MSPTTPEALLPSTKAHNESVYKDWKFILLETEYISYNMFLLVFIQVTTFELQQNIAALLNKATVQQIPCMVFSVKCLWKKRKTVMRNSWLPCSWESWEDSPHQPHLHASSSPIQRTRNHSHVNYTRFSGFLNGSLLFVKRMENTTDF